MHIVDLSDSTYEQLKGLKGQLRVLAEGQKITDEMTLAEAMSITEEMFKDDSFLEGYTEGMRSRLRDFREQNK
ncbi:MAG: hypothetical protein ABSB56_00730 [Nitrososphaerales archaeon]|jgi:hypothetical protein